MSAPAKPAAADESGNLKVHVAVRIRPRIASAQNVSQAAERHMPTAAIRVGDDSIRMTDLKSDEGKPVAAKESEDVKTQQFAFDAVFDEESLQEEVYQETTLAAVDGALANGENATIMTYGQTGSGKTFTVLGTVSSNPLDGDDVVVKDSGLLLRVLRDVLDFKKKKAKDIHVTVCVSVLEIYLDNVRDLLGKDSKETLKVVISQETVEMPDVVYEPIVSLRDAVACYRKATSRRVSRATDMNDASSRSHALFCIEVFQQQITPENPEPLTLAELLTAKDKAKTKIATGAPFSSLKPGLPPLKHSRIVLTDLAGSEKMRDKNAKGDALEEMKKINGSLTCLGNVVHSLYMGSKHVPYRDSKLTVVLRSSFATPNATVVLIANVAPTSLTYDETLSTLFFANKVKTMKAAGGQQGGADALLENELLQAVKTSDELVGDLKLCALLNGPGFPCGTVTRRVGLRTGPFAKPKEANSKAMVTAAAAKQKPLGLEAQEKDAKRVQAELDEERKKKVSEAKEWAVSRRRELDFSCVEAYAEEKQAEQLSNELFKQWGEDAVASQKDVDELLGENTTLKSKEEGLNKELVPLRSTLEGLLTGIAAMEAKFKKDNSKEVAVWEKEDAQEDARARFYEKQMKSMRKAADGRQLRQETLETKTSVVKAAVEKSEAEAAYMTELSGEWIRPIVLGVVDTAIEAARRRSNQQRRPRIGLRPQPQPTLKSESSFTAAPGSPKRHLDPNAGAGRQSSLSPGLARQPSLSPGVARQPSLSPSTSGRMPSVSPGRALRTAPSTRPAAAGSPKASDSFRKQPGQAEKEKNKQDTVFDNPSLFRDVVSYIGAGAKLLKHGRTGRPHVRFVYGWNLQQPGVVVSDLATVDPKNMAISYCEDRESRTNPGQPSVPIAAITGVQLGQSSQVFKRHRRYEDQYRSFTVTYLEEQSERTLDLVCSSDAEYEAWVIAFCVLAGVNPTFPEQVEKLENLPPGSPELSEEEVALCREWHVRPQVLVSTKERIVAAKERRGVASLPLTPGALRFVAGIDIFRSNALWRLFVRQELIAMDDAAVQYLEYDQDDEELLEEGM